MSAVDASSDYKLAAKDNYRDPRCRVEVQWNASATQASMNVYSTDENRGAIMTQVTDGNNVTSYKYAHLYPGNGVDTFKLDGTFHPGPSSASSAQIGWFGSIISDANGDFLAPNVPELYLTYNEASLTGSNINIICDTQYNQYPVDYSVSIYFGSTLLYVDAVTGNSSPNITVDLTGQTLNSTTSIIMSITKWSAPYGVVKIVEFSVEKKEIYYDSDVLGINILEEMEYENGSLPIGNISSNQVELNLLNKENRFDIGNTNSEYHNLLLQDRRIKIWLGFVLPAGSTDTTNNTYIVETINGDKVGFLPMGTFWSKDWIVDKRSVSCKTTGRDVFEKLRQIEFEESDLYENVSLYDLADTVLTSANNKLIANNEDSISWEIDTNLQNFNVPYGFFEKKSYFECIKDIVTVGQTTAYVSRDNIIIVGATL